MCRALVENTRACACATETHEKHHFLWFAIQILRPCFLVICFLRLLTFLHELMVGIGSHCFVLIQIFSLLSDEGKDIASLELDDMDVFQDDEAESRDLVSGSVDDFRQSHTGSDSQGAPGAPEPRTGIQNGTEAGLPEASPEQMEVESSPIDVVDGIDDHMAAVSDNREVSDNRVPRGLDSVPSCEVPNSDSGFVDQSSITSASNPDIRACSLTSPPEGHGHTGFNSPLGVKSPLGLTGGIMYSKVIGLKTEGTKPLELTDLNSQHGGPTKMKSNSTSPSNTGSPNDSSPGSGGQQRSPSQQGWFAPPSPSIAPSLPTHSKVTSAPGRQGNQEKCQVTTATKAIPSASVGVGTTSEYLQEEPAPAPPVRTSSKNHPQEPPRPHPASVLPKPSGKTSASSRSTTASSGQEKANISSNSKCVRTQADTGKTLSSEISSDTLIGPQEKQYVNVIVRHHPRDAQDINHSGKRTTQDHPRTCHQGQQSPSNEIHDVTVTSPSFNPASSITQHYTESTSPTTSNSPDPHGNPGSHVAKPLSAIPGRVSRSHHQMEQRQFRSHTSGSSPSGFSTSGSTSSSSGSSSFGFSPLGSVTLAGTGTSGSSSSSSGSSVFGSVTLISGSNTSCSSGSASSSNQNSPTPESNDLTKTKQDTKDSRSHAKEATTDRDLLPTEEIPKRTFLKDSGLPSNSALPCYQHKSMSRSHPPAAGGPVMRAMRPASASAAQSASAGKPTLSTRSAPGSPTRVMTSSTSSKGIPTPKGGSQAGLRSRIPSGGHKHTSVQQVPDRKNQNAALPQPEERNALSLRPNSGTSGYKKKTNNKTSLSTTDHSRSAQGKCLFVFLFQAC